MNRLGIALVTVLLACLSQFGVAADLEIRQFTRPATRPAAPPTTRPAARVSADAEPALQQLADAYGKLASLTLTGKLALVIDDGQTSRREATFASSYAAPNRFRHEIADQIVLGCTGQEAFGYSPRRNTYARADAAQGKVMLRQQMREIAQVLPRQDLSLALALSRDASAELRELASEISKLPDETIDGQPYTALRVVLADGADIGVLLLDQRTRLLRRVSTDLRPSLTKAGRPDIKLATFTIDYISVVPNGPIPDEALAWAAPAGARQISGRGGDVGDDVEAQASELVGKPAPDFTLEDLDGNEVHLADLRGSVVVLDFWATWCGPCVAAMPHLDKIYRESRAAGLKVFAVNQGEPKEKAAQFIENHNISIPVLLDTQKQVGGQYKVTGIPTTVIIGKDGNVKKVVVGFNPAGDDDLRNAIAQELKEMRSAE